MNENSPLSNQNDAGRERQPDYNTPLKSDTKLVTDEDTPATAEGETTGSVNAAYWSKVPVGKSGAQEKPFSAPAPTTPAAESQTQSTTPRQNSKGKMIRLVLFAVAAMTISLGVQLGYDITQQFKQLDPNNVTPNPNQLALGSAANVRGTIDIPVNPPSELDFLTQKQIVEMRTKAVNQHPELLAKPYSAFGPVWAGIADSRPWWGIKGYYWRGEGTKGEEGPSLEGPLTANPFILTQPSFDERLEWSAGVNPNSPGFVFTCTPTDIKWTPEKSKMEQTIDISGFYRKYKEQGGTSSLEKVSTWGIDDYNAYDMGYAWKSISVNGGLLTPGVVRINSFLHCGKTMGVPCNNRGTLVNSDWADYGLKAGETVEVKLWRTRPDGKEIKNGVIWSDAKPDFTCIWHVK